jgi:hypothetical protein
MWWAELLNTVLGSLSSGVPPITGSYESIATFTLGSNSSSEVIFTSIPSTYASLQIRSLSQVTANSLTYLYLQFNGDTGSNYMAHRLSGSGATVTATSFSPTEIALGMVAGTSSNNWTGCIADIHDYASTTKYKTLRSISGCDNNGSGTIALLSGLWMSTSAITSMRIFGNTYAAGSTFALYGIKG